MNEPTSGAKARQKSGPGAWPAGRSMAGMNMYSFLLVPCLPTGRLVRNDMEAETTLAKEGFNSVKKRVKA